MVDQVTRLTTPSLEPLLETGDHRCGLFRNEDDRVVATTIESACDSRSRNRGLLGRDGLAPGAVIILAPCNSVHTWYMRFAIDMCLSRATGGW